MPISKYTVDWPRISRWSAWGALILLVILLWPTTKCAWQGFGDTPLVEYEELESNEEVEPERSDEGFIAGFVGAVRLCYSEQGIAAQERWKRDAFFGLLGLAILASILHRLLNKRSMSDGY